jgi:plasmid stabilization system protein ParE
MEVTEYKVGQITSHPHIGIRSFIADDVRSVLITRHNRLYYRISEQTIEIINIFDTRQDPLKNKFE